MSHTHTHTHLSQTAIFGVVAVTLALRTVGMMARVVAMGLKLGPLAMGIMGRQQWL